MKALIAILGAHTQPEQMQAQRETWFIDCPCDYLYFLGEPYTNASAEDMPDIFRIEGLPDGPNWEGTARTPHMLRKVEALVKYAWDGGYDFVFKCDDDTYVRPRQLVESGFEHWDYTGGREVTWVNQPVEKTGAPGRFIFEFGQGGPGYWLSRKAMQVILDHGLHLYPGEDVAVGQLLALNGIRLHPDPRYITIERKTAIPDSFLTLHKVGPAEMREFYRKDSARQIA